MASQQKSFTGTVVSDKMMKTVIVEVERTTRHRLYKKIMRRAKRYMAHDDRLGAKVGDQVRILETRPLSRHKRWRVIEIVKRGEVAEIAPSDIDAEYLSLRRERETPAVPQEAAEPAGAAAEPLAPEPAEGTGAGAPQAPGEAELSPSAGETSAGPEATESTEEGEP